MTGPAAARLPDGRLHFQHGPIDLIVEACGPTDEVTAAYRQAWTAFRPVLEELVAVLPTLRTPMADLLAAGTGGPAAVDEGPTPPAGHPPVGQGPTRPADPGLTDGQGHTPATTRRVGPRPTASLAIQGRSPRPGASLPPRGLGRNTEVDPVDRFPGPEMERGRDRSPGGRVPPSPPLAVPPHLPSPAAAMIAAAARHAPACVTPMAAVAGAVADHVLAAMTGGRRLTRAWVNNGGDAALWLTPGTEITAAGGPALADRIRVTHESPVRGIATSGWRGRSHSLGIADAVTVLARTAAEADVAATLIANAVDLPGHAAITRRPARALAPDSDLGDRPVTVAVGALAPDEIDRALAAGRAAAGRMLAAGLIQGAALWLAGACVTVGDGLPAGPDSPAG